MPYLTRLLHLPVAAWALCASGPVLVGADSGGSEACADCHAEAVETTAASAAAPAFSSIWN